MRQTVFPKILRTKLPKIALAPVLSISNLFPKEAFCSTCVWQVLWSSVGQRFLYPLILFSFKRNKPTTFDLNHLKEGRIHYLRMNFPAFLSSNPNVRTGIKISSMSKKILKNESMNWIGGGMIYSSFFTILFFKIPYQIQYFTLHLKRNLIQ